MIARLVEGAYFLIPEIFNNAAGIACCVGRTELCGVVRYIAVVVRRSRRLGAREGVEQR